MIAHAVEMDNKASTHILRKPPPLVAGWRNNKGGVSKTLENRPKSDDFLQGISNRVRALTLVGMFGVPHPLARPAEQNRCVSESSVKKQILKGFSEVFQCVL